MDAREIRYLDKLKLEHAERAGCRETGGEPWRRM